MILTDDTLDWVDIDTSPFLSKVYREIHVDPKISLVGSLFGKSDIISFLSLIYLLFCGHDKHTGRKGE